MVEAQSLGYMCSYAALTNSQLIPDGAEPSHPHSEPCCASKFFAQTKMAEECVPPHSAAAVAACYTRRLKVSPSGRSRGGWWVDCVMAAGADLSRVVGPMRGGTMRWSIAGVGSSQHDNPAFRELTANIAARATCPPFSPGY